MTMKRIFAVCLALLMVLAFAACGSKEPEAPADTTAAVENNDVDVTTDADVTAEEPVSNDEVTEPAATEASATEANEADATTEAAATEAATEAEEENKVPQTKEEIVEFYKKAAATSDKAGVKTSNIMKLEDLNGGGGAVGAFVNLLKPIVSSTLERNSSTDNHITGGYQNLTADDVASATATQSADGKYTTLTINLKEQTDGMNGKSKEGHVGHGVSILDGVQTAIDQLDGVTVDASEGEIKLHYNNAYIDCKVDNTTGKVVSGKWHYTVNVTINNVKAKIGIVSATLNGAKGVVEYAVTL